MDSLGIVTIRLHLEAFLFLVIMMLNFDTFNSCYYGYLKYIFIVII